MTRLSVNINKVATLRNARGGNLPDVEQFAKDCEGFGAEGITVHPRPDERHITRKDVYALKEIVTTEFNIEGNPEPAFMDLVLAVKPAQVTLVPDAHDQLTSNHGWDTKAHLAKLTTIIQRFKLAGIRVSVFVDARTISSPVSVTSIALRMASTIFLLSNITTLPSRFTTCLTICMSFYIFRGGILHKTGGRQR